MRILKSPPCFILLNMTAFLTASILLAFVCMGVGVSIAFGWRARPDFPSWLCRNRPLGIVLGAIVLFWCAWEGVQMLPEGYGRIVWCAYPIALALCSWLLDYPFARAAGGLLILLANHAIQHAFAYHCPMRPVFALACLAVGCAGMVFVAWPWHWRIIMEESAKNPKRGKRYLVLSCVCAAVIFLLPLFGAFFHRA